MQVLNNFKTSVEKALTEIDPKWESYNGLIICGTHTPHDTEYMIDRIRMAREKKIPSLFICAGHQLCAIEYARNVLGIEDATSEEFGKGTFVVKKRKEGLKVGLIDGESWWNNYEVDYLLLNGFERDKPPYFVTCQFHPEYQSSADKPHYLLVKFLNLCKLESQNH